MSERTKGTTVVTSENIGGKNLPKGVVLVNCHRHKIHNYLSFELRKVERFRREGTSAIRLMTSNRYEAEFLLGKTL